MKSDYNNLPKLPLSRRLFFEAQPSELSFGHDLLAPLDSIPHNSKIIDEKERSMERKRVTKRLISIIHEHQIVANRLGVEFNHILIHRTIDALIAEASATTSAANLVDLNEVTQYLLTSLYEELLEEPSNILYTTKVSIDVVRYEAMDVLFWKECLIELRHHFTPLSSQ